MKYLDDMDKTFLTVMGLLFAGLLAVVLVASYAIHLEQEACIEQLVGHGARPLEAAGACR